MPPSVIVLGTQLDKIAISMALDRVVWEPIEAQIVPQKIKIKVYTYM